MNRTTSLFAIAAVLPFLATAGEARAADYGLAPSTYDWSGGYVGLNGGMGFNMSSFKTGYHYAGTVEAQFATPEATRGLGFGGDVSDSSFSGGALAGYNWQYASFVIGMEGDFNYLALNGRARHNVDGVLNDNVFGAANQVRGAYDTVDYQGNWYGTLRARLGYAFDNVLVYGTGGLAYGDLEVTENLAATAGAGSTAESVDWSGKTQGWRFGWTLGGGMEYGIDRWTLGLEYLYVDLGAYDWHALPVVSLAGDNSETAAAEWSQVKQNGTMDYRFGVARASLKYRF